MDKVKDRWMHKYMNKWMYLVCGLVYRQMSEGLYDYMYMFVCVQ